MSIQNKDVKQTTNKADTKISENSEKSKQAVVSEQKNAQSGKATNNKNFNKKSNVAPNPSVNNPKKDQQKEVEKVAEKPIEKSVEKQVEKPVKEEKKKSGGTAIALLALLISLGVGGAGYYFGMQKFNQLEQKIASHSQLTSQSGTVQSVSSEALNQQLTELNASFEEKIKSEIQIVSAEVTKLQQQIQVATTAKTAESTDGESTSTESATVTAESQSQQTEELAKLIADYQQSQQKLAKLEAEQTAYAQQISQLKTELQTVANVASSTQTRSTASVLADTGFLLNNVLRKIQSDKDIESAKVLLKDAEKVVADLTTPESVKLQQAIQSDLKTLANVKEVDQDALMLKLTQLAKQVDDLPMLSSEDAPEEKSAENVSSSLEDWKKNLEKNADSFLSKFIRISDKDGSSAQKLFTAPSQEAYLRENIRLRLQIATLAISREQTTLYKESLETVAAWVRSYFDAENSNVKAFLGEIDKLAEQPISTDVPQQLSSLDLLNSLSGQSEQATEQ